MARGAEGEEEEEEEEIEELWEKILVLFHLSISHRESARARRRTSFVSR